MLNVRPHSEAPHLKCLGSSITERERKANIIASNRIIHMLRREVRVRAIQSCTVPLRDLGRGKNGPGENNSAAILRQGKLPLTFNR